MGPGTRENEGEKQPDSAESESSIHGLRYRGRGRAVAMVVDTGLSSTQMGAVRSMKQNIVKWNVYEFSASFSLWSNRGAVRFTVPSAYPH